MSFQVCSGIVCNITDVDSNAFNLTVNFQGINSEAALNFKRKKQPDKGTKVLDVFTKNAICITSDPDQFIRKTFCKKSLQEAVKASELNGENHQGCVVIVVDLKSESVRYAPNDDVAKCEKIIQGFFKGHSEKPKNISERVRKVLKEQLNVDYVLCEGSLKIRLLSIFKKDEADYLNSPSGAKDFCALTEFFMTAFKMGFKAFSKDQKIKGKEFFLPVSEDGPAFKPCAESEVYYPSLYKDMYSLEGNYAKLMSKAFKVSGYYDETTKISVINLEKPEEKV